MRLANLALAEMTEALDHAWGDLDSQAAMMLQEERAGVQSRLVGTARPSRPRWRTRREPSDCARRSYVS
jgi:hypothetical protein